MVKRIVPCVVVAAICLAAIPAEAVAPNHSRTAFINWTGYLNGASHPSESPATAITPANAAHLKRKWGVRLPGPTPGQPPAGFVASPTVYNGTIYIGDNTGVFYAVTEATGQIVWSQSLGYVIQQTCAARGISSTATVAVDPSTGAPTVYVAGGDGFLYALSAATGKVVWKSVVSVRSATVNDYYIWSSPAVANGFVYIGVSSQCDTPLVKGAGLKAYDQVTGALEATYLTMPANVLGGSIWSSPDVGPKGDVFVTTGNALPGAPDPADSSSIVGLTGAGLVRENAWRIPVGVQVQDNDWAASPISFVAKLGGVPTEMVGACNKNGNFYAMNAHDIGAGPVWSFQVGVGTGNGVQSCLGATIWDGTALYQPGNATTINGVNYFGSVRRLDPSTGLPAWQTGLPGIVLGSPSKDAAGVVAAATYGPTTTSGTYLLNAADGSILNFIHIGAEFAQPVFADRYLILATNGGGLNVYGP